MPAFYVEYNIINVWQLLDLLPLSLMQKAPDKETFTCKAVQ